MLKRWKIRTRLGLFVAVPFLAMLLLGIFGWNTFQAARLEGPRDRLRQSAHDTVADALPPPLYLVESYLTVNLITQAGDTPERAELIKHLGRLEAEFNARIDFWTDNQPFPELRESILGPVKTTGEEFFFQTNAEFLPAVNTNDSATANTLMAGDLRRLYEKQRAAVDVLIERSKERVASTDAEVSAYVAGRALALTIGFGLIVLVTILLAAAIARSIVRSVYRLRKAAMEDLPLAIANIRNLNLEPGKKPTIEPIDLGTQDELADAATAFNTVLQTAVDLAAEQAQLRHHTSEVFVNLGRRNQNLVSRQLKFIDVLEERETDPELLSSLFRLDHLATRMRRNAESLLVLAGVEPSRRRREPVATNDVLRAAAAEVEDYKRVVLKELNRSHIAGEVMAQITHLLAELIENAVRYSPPDTNVDVLSRVINGSIVIEIADQGTGIAPAELDRVNRRLGESHRIDDVPAAHLGLFVVGRLASTLGIVVSLSSHSGEGLVATVTIPPTLVVRKDDVTASYSPGLADRAPAVRTARTETGASPDPVSSFRPLAQSPAPVAIASVPGHALDQSAKSIPWGAPQNPLAESPQRGPEVTATGFARRAKPTAVKPNASDSLVSPQERSPLDVRSRLDGFSTGRRRGLDANAEAPVIDPAGEKNQQ